MSPVRFSSNSNPGLAHLTVKTFHSCGEANWLEAGIQKVGTKIWILGCRRTLGSQGNFGSKTNFLTFFLKHKLHFILPMIVLKKSEKC
jgi:hypothetical protein